MMMVNPRRVMGVANALRSGFIRPRRPGRYAGTDFVNEIVANLNSNRNLGDTSNLTDEYGSRMLRRLKIGTKIDDGRWNTRRFWYDTHRDEVGPLNEGHLGTLDTLIDDKYTGIGWWLPYLNNGSEPFEDDVAVGLYLGLTTAPETPPGSVGKEVCLLIGGGTDLAIVNLAQSGGADGSDSAPPTYLYNVTIAGTSIITNASPLFSRPNGAFFPANYGFAGSYEGAMSLIYAHEIPRTATCAASGTTGGFGGFLGGTDEFTRVRAITGAGLLQATTGGGSPVSRPG